MTGGKGLCNPPRVDRGLKAQLLRHLLVCHPAHLSLMDAMKALDPRQARLVCRRRRINRHQSPLDRSTLSRSTQPTFQSLLAKPLVYRVHDDTFLLIICLDVLPNVPERQMKQMNLDGISETPNPVPPPKAPTRKEGLSPSPSSSSVPVGASAAGAAQPGSATEQATPGALPAQRRPKPKASDDFVERLRAIVNPEDPTKLYRNFVKIGQG